MTDENSSVAGNKWVREKDWPKGLCRHEPSGYYHWRRMVDGQRDSKSLKTRKLAVAINKATKVNADIEEKGLSPKKALNKEKMPFMDAAKSYMAARDLRPSSLKRYAATLKNFTRIAEEITGKSVVLVTDVNGSLLAQYVEMRRTQPSSPNGHPNTPKSNAGATPKTIAVEKDLIASVLKHAVDRDWLVALPNLSVKIPGFTSRKDQSEKIRPLTEQELPKMLAAANNYDVELAGQFPYATYFHDIVLAYVYSGLRHEELQFLEWTDIDFPADCLSVKKKKVKATRVRVLTEDAQKSLAALAHGKHGTQPLIPAGAGAIRDYGYMIGIRNLDVLKSLRVKDLELDKGVLTVVEELSWQPKATEGSVPLHPRLRVILEALKGQSPSNFVFPDLDGGYWKMHFERHLQRIAQMAGIKTLTRVHDLRHTTGTMLRRHGVPLETIQEILRHQNIQDTLIYARYEVEEGKKAIRRLPDWS